MLNLTEGGSGGALAIAVGDTLQMLQYSTYSVISPEGCASILWKSAERAPEAAETMGITAQRLKTLGLVDKIINEPLGGAHRDHPLMAQNLKKALQESLKQLSALSCEQLLEQRYERLMSYGRFKEQVFGSALPFITLVSHIGRCVAFERYREWRCCRY